MKLIFFMFGRWLWGVGVGVGGSLKLFNLLVDFCFELINICPLSSSNKSVYTACFLTFQAQKKEERLVEALKKTEPKETSETTHDPEILTPEEHFFFLKMGLKCKNYVPVGRRGIYQGVILNMHLHWKKHQTLQVIVKTFSPEEVKEIAAELARLTGGIVLDIHEENTIIMYRGKNYSQPPTEIMSPRVTLSRKKVLISFFSPNILYEDWINCVHFCSMVYILGSFRHYFSSVPLTILLFFH